jgi:hypothetical protein
MAEEYADGLLGPEDLWKAYTLLPNVPGRRVAIPRKFDVWEARDVCNWVAQLDTDPEEQADPDQLVIAQRRREQCLLLRDVVGNPFCPVILRPIWRTSDVCALARVIDEERAWPGGRLDGARMAVLGDALEEAGCTSQDILDHCRGAGPHVRGCWVLDLVRRVTM